MPTYVKILIAAVGILLLGAVALVVYRGEQLSNRQTAIEAQMVGQKTLIDDITRSQSTYATKNDIQQFIKDNNVNLQAIKDDLAKLNATVSAINVVTATSTGFKGTGLPSTNVGPANPNPPVPTPSNPNPDPNGFLTRQQNFTLSENFSSGGTTTWVPIGDVGFSAWQNNPWNVNILPRTYKIVNVLGTDENRRNYMYNKMSVNVGGKDYSIPITTAQTEQVYPEAKFSWWNPRLYMNVSGGMDLSPFRGEVTPSFQVGFMSYGMYKNQPDFSILQLGVGYGVNSQQLEFLLTPITYNVGQHLPLMNNLYVGPSLQLGLKGDFAIMFGISVGL